LPAIINQYSINIQSRFNQDSIKIQSRFNQDFTNILQISYKDFKDRCPRRAFEGLLRCQRDAQELIIVFFLTTATAFDCFIGFMADFAEVFKNACSTSSLRIHTCASFNRTVGVFD
jgi:hypothetical protein